LTGRELRRQRLRLELTQTELAEKLDINRGTVIRYESGSRPIPKLFEWAIKGLLADAGVVKKE
jgi:transcriptional regulator with XRE-family HTH domain